MDTQEHPQNEETKQEKEVDYTIKKPWEEKKSLPVVKGTELFIGNLNIDTREDELYNLFSPNGIITDVRMFFIPRFACTRIPKQKNVMRLLDIKLKKKQTAQFL